MVKGGVRPVCEGAGDVKAEGAPRDRSAAPAPATEPDGHAPHPQHIVSLSPHTTRCS